VFDAHDGQSTTCGQRESLTFIVPPNFNRLLIERDVSGCQAAEVFLLSMSL
jgi:hypothetical protein